MTQTESYPSDSASGPMARTWRGSAMPQLFGMVTPNRMTSSAPPGRTGSRRCAPAGSRSRRASYPRPVGGSQAAPRLDAPAPVVLVEPGNADPGIDAELLAIAAGRREVASQLVDVPLHPIIRRSA